MSQERHSEAHQVSSPPEAVHTGHPSPGTYFKVAMTLTILTAIEVTVLYMGFLGHLILAVLGLLSTAKFILVAMYYMHLKFDSRIFSLMFVGGLVVAALIIISLMGLLRFFVAGS
jgi:cytochrome c oxidase subunit 4